MQLAGLKGTNSSMKRNLEPAHVACIVGGGVAGSEAAHQLVERGVRCVVFEMDALPWGKIELGLPKWHVKQRNMEEDKIDEKMMHPLVEYVPLTKLGKDIAFEELAGWGFSVILLAVGAWKDRPLPVPGIDEFEGRGFYYQNPYVSWFNQYHSPRYDGPQMELLDDALIVGGGLASLDVVKILMLETTLRALRERGIEADFFEMEKKGIPKVLDRLGVQWDELGLKGCTLFYRRRAIDMPLVPMDENPPPERLAQAQKVRQKLMDNFLTKFLFKFQPCMVPVDKIVENGRVVGLKFQRTEVVDGRVRTLPGAEIEVRTPLVISSIGSIPEPIPGFPMEWELFRISDPETGKLDDFDNVFALGNAVTGRGNIQASRVHGRQVSDWVMDNFLEWRPKDFEEYARAVEERTAAAVERIVEFAREKQLRTPEQIEAILANARRCQRKVGYEGDYASWLEAHRPIRLEEMQAELSRESAG